MFTSERKSDIEALLTKISSQFSEIESQYRASLEKRQISSELKVEVKNFLENARSVLDYCAHEIGQKIGLPENQNIYFPVVEKNAQEANFKGSIGRSLPGLETKAATIYQYLESIQPYHSGYAWIVDFATIAAENKHTQLTPQKRFETEMVVSKSENGGTAAWNPSAVRFGAGVFINGAAVNSHSQLPEKVSGVTVTKEIWVDFTFDDGNSVLSLLRTIKEQLPLIVLEIEKLV